jgi:Xaa-Pro dipeptidase
MMSPVTDAGAVGVADASATADAAYRQRKQRSVEVLAEVGLRQAIFVSTGRHLFTDMDPVVWLTGFKPMGAASAVLDDTGDLVLYVEGPWEAARARRGVSNAEVIASEAPLSEAAKRVLGRGQSQAASAGVRKLNAAEYRAVTGDGGIELRAVDPELDARARLKDELEMTCYERATEIAEEGFRSFLEQLRPGMTDVEAEALIERRLRELGSDDAFVFLSASVRNRAVQRPWGRLLLPGDIVITELSPSVGGVFAQICRTVSIGEPSAALATSHQLLCDALSQGIDACKPGQTVSDVVAAIDDRLIAEGYGDYCRPPFMRVRGHGMGFGSVAPGDFLSRNSTSLQFGDTFVLHPNQMLPAAGYLMCGEPVRVGADRAELMSAAVAELAVVSA